MGIERYKVRASRLVKHLAESFGLNLTHSQGLAAIAAEEGIPRANWNVLSAQASGEVAVNQSEVVVGRSGVGKTVHVKQTLVEAVAIKRPTLVITPRDPDYTHLVRSLSGHVYRAEEGVGLKHERGLRNLALLTWDGLSFATPKLNISLKDLGFTKPEIREMLVVCDELFAYSNAAWFKEMLQQLKEHECATVILVAQSLEDAIPSCVAAGVNRLRMFWMQEYEAKRLFDTETAALISRLPVGQSVVCGISYIPAHADFTNLQDISASEITAVTSNVHAKVFIKLDETDIKALRLARGIVVRRRDNGEVSLEVRDFATDNDLEEALALWLQADPCTVHIMGIAGHDVEKRAAYPGLVAKLKAAGHQVSNSIAQ